MKNPNLMNPYFGGQPGVPAAPQYGLNMGNPMSNVPPQLPYGPYATGPSAYGPGPAAGYGPEEGFPPPMPAGIDSLGMNAPFYPGTVSPGMDEKFEMPNWQYPTTYQPMMKAPCGCGVHHQHISFEPHGGPFMGPGMMGYGPGFQGLPPGIPGYPPTGFGPGNGRG